MNPEVLAGIKVLVALAQADGKIHDDERMAIENAVDWDEAQAAALIDSKIDLDAELAHITTEDARKRCYDAACALVFVDGHISPEERELLAHIAEKLEIEEEGRASRFEKFTTAMPPSLAAEVSDVQKRETLVKDEIGRASEVSAVLATWPLPIAAESCTFTNNTRLACNIGLFYGHGHGAEESYWRTFVANVVGAASSWFAVSTLQKLVPGSGAAAAYATTYALGKATELYFEKNERVESDVLRETFKNAKKEGLAIAKEAKPRIAARKEQLDRGKTALDAELSAGTITETAYADRLVALS
jgi:uncharacterized protein (DUF697 family)